MTRAATAADPAQLARDVARCFAHAEGARVLAHLRRITFERRLAPDCSEAELRHLEGQRHLVAQLLALEARGRAGPVPPSPEPDAAPSDT